MNCRHHDFQSCALPTELPRPGRNTLGGISTIPYGSPEYEGAATQSDENPPNHVEWIMHAKGESRPPNEDGDEPQSDARTGEQSREGVGTGRRRRGVS